MNNITIYTIIYNNYGMFLKEWLKNVKLNKPKKIIVVLGKNHGVENKKQYIGVKFIEIDSDIMGTLRNAAIEHIETEWSLYFSVDDILLPNAVEDIISHNSDAVTLRYINEDTLGNKTDRISAYYNIKDIPKWKQIDIPGYIAIKGKYLYEDIEIPNYPYLFKLALLGLKIEHSKDICAIYKRRENSHGNISLKTNRYIKFTKTIDNYAKMYYREYMLSKGYVEIEATRDYTDTRLKKGVRLYNRYYVDRKRADEIIAKGYAKEVK